ncbi:MAG TPA: hypothetical protein VEB21_12795 [Terriglobales bacterium]|nr:hypothetical protein [Terriglobales bacterium]
MRLLVGFLALASLAGGGEAAAATPTEPPPAATIASSEPEAVIPPGKENLLAEMLGMGVDLPGNCKFSGAQADYILIRSTYRCGNDDIDIELRHPDKVPASTSQTDSFAIVVTSGTAPPALVEALLERIRAREDGFEWSWVGGSAHSFSFVQAAVAVAVLWLAVAALWLLFRRRRAADNRAGSF